MSFSIVISSGQTVKINEQADRVHTNLASRYGLEDLFASVAGRVIRLDRNTCLFEIVVL